MATATAKPDMSEFVSMMDWKIPKLKSGDLIRFVYWNSEFNDYRGYKGYVSSIRYLNHRPVSQDAKDNRDIKRGSVLYGIQVNGDILQFYNQRMASVEIVNHRSSFGTLSLDMCLEYGTIES